jgi:hypothetical protein
MNALAWIFRPSAGRGGIISNECAPVVYLLCSSAHDIQPIGGIYPTPNCLSSPRKRRNWSDAT